MVTNQKDLQPDRLLLLIFRPMGDLEKRPSRSTKTRNNNLRVPVWLRCCQTVQSGPIWLAIFNLTWTWQPINKDVAGFRMYCKDDVAGPAVNTKPRPLHGAGFSSHICASHRTSGGFWDGCGSSPVINAPKDCTNRSSSRWRIKGSRLDLIGITKWMFGICCPRFCSCHHHPHCPPHHLVPLWL